MSLTLVRRIEIEGTEKALAQRTKKPAEVSF